MFAGQKVNIQKVLGLIPDDLLAKFAKDTKVDYCAKVLYGQRISPFREVCDFVVSIFVVFNYQIKAMRGTLSECLLKQSGRVFLPAVFEPFEIIKFIRIAG